MSEEVIKRSREEVGSILGTFGKDKYAASVFMSTEQPIYLQMAPTLKSERDKMKRYFGFDAFLSEVIGNWPKYRLVIGIIGQYLSDVDGTSLSTLCRSTFGLMDRFMPDYYRTSGTRGFPYEEARPDYRFKKRFKEEMKRWDKYGNVEFDERREIVKKGNIIPELIPIDFYGDLLHKGRAGFNRALITAKVGVHAPLLYEVHSLLSDAHKANIRRRTVDRWWDLHGPGGTALAFRGRGGRTFLQYEKALYKKPELNIESESFHQIRSTIENLPFVSKPMLKVIHGDKKFREWLEVCNRYPALTPIEVGGSYVPRGLGYLLQWGEKSEISLEQHPARYALTRLYERVIPRAEEIPEFGKTTTELLSELAANQRAKASTQLERLTLNALKPTFVKEKEGDVFEVKEGMLDSITLMAKYSGNIFAGKKSR